jgi:hypothetical protein
MSEDNAQNHANFTDAISMTARAIKIDKRLPYFSGGRAGNIQLMAFYPAVNSLLQKAVKKNIGSIQKQ